MVTISNYFVKTNSNGDEYCLLEVRGGLDVVKSKTSGRYYVTTQYATVACVFDEATCKELVGKQMPGTIKLVDIPAYTKKNDEGKLVQVSHRWDYVPEQEQIQPSIPTKEPDLREVLEGAKQRRELKLNPKEETVITDLPF